MNSRENQECKLLGAPRERMSPAESYLGSSWRNMKKMVTREHRLTTDTNCIAVLAGLKKKKKAKVD